MNRFLVCDNPSCRFLLDLRIDGMSIRRSHFVVANWSSLCPSCGQLLAVKSQVDFRASPAVSKSPWSSMA